MTQDSLPRRLVVVGNGMAGCRFVQEVLARDPDQPLGITVVGDEPGGAYNRLQLSNVLAGVAGADSIELAGEQWYAAQGVTLRTGTAVVSIDRRARRVRLDDGDMLPYDILVLATGSSPVLPPVDGLLDGNGSLLPGAVAFRTLTDCMAIAQLAANAEHAVVLGAGVLGLETARGLAGRGLRATLVQRGPRLMERQLDAGASRVLTRTVGSLGVDVRPGTGIREVRGDSRVLGVMLDDGGALDADLLVLCCGVRPRVELAREAGLAVAAGVVVDDRLRSITDPRIFAIGECAEHRGRTHGLVAPSWEQARVAAQVITRPGEPVSYPGSISVTRVKPPRTRRTRPPTRTRRR
jgi:NAD(P)H-nitrite reductase large subunit